MPSPIADHDVRYPTTPDGRYFVVRGRLWRKANPDLPPEQKEQLVRALMDARRALRGNRSLEERAVARRAVDEAKQQLGERGAVWWTDGAPDFNRKMARTTPYADWFSSIESPLKPGKARRLDPVGICLQAHGPTAGSTRLADAGNSDSSMTDGDRRG